MQEVAWSGIGVYSSYTEQFDKPNDGFLMRDIYEYTDLAVTRRLGLEPEKWDFSSFVPDAVIINLGANDSTYCRDQPDLHAAFAEEYRRLLQTVRRHNPGVPIICALGPLTDYIEYLFKEIEKLVAQLKSAGDELLFSFSFAPVSEEEGIGGGHHPSMATQIRMSRELIPALQNILGW